MGKIVINGISFEVPPGSSVSVNNDEVRINGKIANIGTIPSNRKLTLDIIDGSPISIEADGDVNCKNVLGNVRAGADITCHNVEGSVQAGTDVNCQDVKGDVQAGCDVHCGNIGGDVDAGCDVNCRK